MGVRRNHGEPAAQVALPEQASHWSGLPVVHLRPTVLLDGLFLLFTSDPVKHRDQIKLPFGECKTSPIAAEEVAPVITALLAPKRQVRRQAACRHTIQPLLRRSPVGSFHDPASPQVAWLSRQQHDAVGIEPLRLQSVDATQHLVRLQVNHRDGPIAHTL